MNELRQGGFTAVEMMIVILTGICLLAVVGFGVAAPHFEAKAFNRFSTKKATYWDAFWSDLRVEAR